MGITTREVVNCEASQKPRTGTGVTETMGRWKKERCEEEQVKKGGTVKRRGLKGGPRGDGTHHTHAHGTYTPYTCVEV